MLAAVCGAVLGAGGHHLAQVLAPPNDLQLRAFHCLAREAAATKGEPAGRVEARAAAYLGRVSLVGATRTELRAAARFVIGLAEDLREDPPARGGRPIGG